VDGEIRVVEATRGGRSFIPTTATTTEPDDLVTFTVAATALSRLRAFLDKEWGP
jgi:trk system potassium uptake protein TrkA